MQARNSTEKRWADVRDWPRKLDRKEIMRLSGKLSAPAVDANNEPTGNAGPVQATLAQRPRDADAAQTLLAIRLRPSRSRRDHNRSVMNTLFGSSV
ncbi:hypothetical protein MASR2M8_18510 [Opitutaceae bacterium]